VTVTALVADLQARGVTLKPEGDKLRVRPVSRLSAQELETLKIHKPEIIAALTSPPTVEPGRPVPSSALSSPSWPASVPGLGPRRVIAFSPCVDCETDAPPDEVLKVGVYEIAMPGATGTWVTYGDVPLCRRHARAR
jgi:hypothetical protein